MNKLIFTAFVLSLSLSAFADKYSEAEARLYPKGLLDLEGKCRNSYDWQKCPVPSMAKVKIAADKFEDGLKLAINEALEKADALEAEAKNLQAIGDEYHELPVGKLYSTAAESLRKKYEALQDGQSEIFMNARNELDHLRTLIKKVEELQNSGKSELIQKTITDFIFDFSNYKSDGRYEMKWILTGDIQNLFSVQIRLEEIAPKGKFTWLHSAFEFFKVDRKYLAKEKYSDDYFILNEDLELLKHILDAEKPLQVTGKKFLIVTPDGIAKKGTSYNVKKNSLVIAYKHTELIEFETKLKHFFPDEGLVPYMRKKFNKAK